jgi:hypothetical protein
MKLVKIKDRRVNQIYTTNGIYGSKYALIRIAIENSNYKNYGKDGIDECTYQLFDKNYKLLEDNYIYTRSRQLNSGIKELIGVVGITHRLQLNCDEYYLEEIQIKGYKVDEIFIYNKKGEKKFKAIVNEILYKDVPHFLILINNKISHFDSLITNNTSGSKIINIKKIGTLGVTHEFI